MAFAAVAGAAVSAVGAIAASSMNSGGTSDASSANNTGYAAQTQAINNATGAARSDLQPYSNLGGSAANELAYEMGLTTPETANTSATKPLTMADVPTTWQNGQTNDPVWEKILNQFNQAHQDRFGIQMNRPWSADADAQNTWNTLAQQYLQAKAAEPQAAPTPYVGQGQKGALLQPYTMEQYKADPLYTPMVTSLAELQATPGYQFQLEQGLQAVNNSAAGKGSLLSGATIKGINDYAQGQAATGYQAAWQRAQQAYQQAFANNQTQKNSNFQKLQSMANNGQSAAGNQGGYSMQGAGMLSGANQNYTNNAGGLALDAGTNNANMFTGIGNAINGGIAQYATRNNNPSVPDYLPSYQSGGSNLNSTINNSFSASNPAFSSSSLVNFLG